MGAGCRRSQRYAQLVFEIEQFADRARARGSDELTYKDPNLPLRDALLVWQSGFGGGDHWAAYSRNAEGRVDWDAKLTSDLALGFLQDGEIWGSGNRIASITAFAASAGEADPAVRLATAIAKHFEHYDVQASAPAVHPVPVSVARDLARTRAPGQVPSLRA